MALLPSPLPPAPAADSRAGREGEDFDALDFSFLDTKRSVLSTEDPSAATAPPGPASGAPETADNNFDSDAWSRIAPAAPPEDSATPPPAAPESGAGPEFDLDAFSFAAESSPPENAPEDSAAPPRPAPESGAGPEFDLDAFSFAAENSAPESAPEDSAAPPPAAPESGAGPEFGLDAFSFAAENSPPESAPEDSAAPPLAKVGKGPKPAPKKTSLKTKDTPGAVVAPPPRKFLFDRSFDYVPPPPPPPEPEPSEDATAAVEAEPSPPPEEVEEPPPPPPPPPTFSEEELAAARAAAYADGETAGLQAAMSSLESRTSRTLESIAQQIPALLDDRQEIVDAVAREAARLAYALAARMMPELARTYGLGEIEAVVRSSLSLAIDQPRLNIRVSPQLAQQLQAKLQAALPSTGFHGHVNLLEDAELGASDVRIEWGDGGAERLVQRAWGELTEIVRRAIGDLKKRTGVEESEPVSQETGT